MASYIDSSLHQIDPQIAKLLEGEYERQTKTLVMIPSENYASRAVLQTMGSILTNKYAEGYPSERYYNGCAYYDMGENLAKERARKLFKAEHVNVQPHTGSAANMAAYYAILDIGDTVLGMSTEHGGHLTHGKNLNFSGKWYDYHSYGVSKKDERLDYDEIREIAKKVKPKLIVCGASAYPRIIDFEIFRSIADEVGAYLMSDIAHIIGLIAAGEHPDPVPHSHIVTSTTHKTLRGPRGAIIMCKRELADAIDRAVFPGTQAGPLMHQIAAKAVCFREAQSFGFKEYQRQIIKNAAILAETLMERGFRLTTGGTDNHLMMIDLSDKGLNGRDAADMLEEAGIAANKNSIPFDTRPPAITSGVRFGTPALTTRGMKEEEMRLIGGWISDVLSNPKNQDLRMKIRASIEELCEQFPIYLDILNW
ncbi:MAG TPA: serine hydroxymethyltransferase [bacterium]|nr:MAG: Serine hydroxymethyltransferase [bacterium ADurb.Bin236]HOY62084.1 serine hydroxymethyltransferase [bacterium]HPI76350.1 serine hydroxymethyltransferase [bacterium]HPN93744.1 serine hydroxymethyltransferase [bacterium]